MLFVSQAQIQMFMSWVDDVNGSTKTGLVSTPFTPSCQFPCDAAFSECCDSEWVPELKISNMEDAGKIESELTGIIGPRVDYSVSYKVGDETTQHTVSCSRHGWSLNIDAMFDADLSFRTFPFDYQTLDVVVFNPFFRHVHFQPLPGMLPTDGNFQDIANGACQTGCSPLLEFV